MKEQYIGDIKDYYKYSIIEFLSKVYDKKVLFAWMLTPPDDKGHGNDTDYLKNTEKYSGYNPSLYKKLKDIVLNDQNKSLSSIEGILKNDNYFFFSEELPIDIKERENYFSKLDIITVKQKTYLVFFDPDNGIEVKSSPKGTKDSNKYIYWDEIKHFWIKGRDMLIFQYIPLYQNHDEYIKEKYEQCIEMLRIKPENINIIRTNTVLFIYLRHEPVYNNQNIKKLRLKINTENTFINFDDLFGQFVDEQDRIYTYHINTNQYMEFSIGTQPINSLIDSDLYKIELNDIEKIKLLKKEKKALEFCNLTEEDLINKYYDKHGNIYYCLDNNEIYKFDLMIKYFSDFFNEEQGKRLKLIACSPDKLLKLYNYGGDYGKWLLKDDKEIFEDGIGGFLGDYISRRYDGMLRHCDENGNFIK